MSIGLWRIDGPAALAAVGLTALALWGSARPILASRAEARAALAQLDEAVDSARRVRADRADLESALSAMQRELASREWNPEPTSELNQRLAKITALASECGLSIDQLTPGGATPAARYTAVPLRLTALGDFRSAAAFLARLRRDFPDTGVVGLRASATPKRSEARAECAVDLVWFAAPAAVMQKK